MTREFRQGEYIGNFFSPEDREELIEMAHRDAKEIRAHSSISGFLEYLMASEKTLQTYRPPLTGVHKIT